MSPGALATVTSSKRKPWHSPATLQATASNSGESKTVSAVFMYRSQESSSEKILRWILFTLHLIEWQTCSRLVVSKIFNLQASRSLPIGIPMLDRSIHSQTLSKIIKVVLSTIIFALSSFALPSSLFFFNWSSRPSAMEL